MKALSVILAILLGIGGLAAAFWFAQSPQQGSQSSAPLSDDEIGPPIAPQGPYPKVVISESEYDFGAGMLGSEGKHVFTIRNEGEAPLQLLARKEDRTCQCTAATLSDDKPIPPGGEIQIEVSWEIRVDADQFRHSAKIRTNDPNQRMIELVIRGQIDAEYHVEPGNVIDLGEALSESPLTGTGVIYSRTKDQFTIAEATSSHPRASCTWTPMTAEELARHQAKSGYKLDFQLDPQATSGLITESIVLKSDERDENGEPKVLVRFGLKLKSPGQAEIIGRSFDPEQNRLSLGEFPAEQGKTAELSVYVRLEQDVKLVATTPENNGIEVSWEKDEKFQSKAGGKQRYKLIFRILPGPPVNRMRGQSEKINLKFDHPEMGDMQLRIDYLSI